MPSIIKLIDNILRRYTPDPIVFAIALTFISLGLSTSYTAYSFTESVSIWGQGFWNLLAFTMQMAMILLGGFVVATSPVVQRFLSLLCRIPRSPEQAIVFTLIISALASWLNWGLGLVTGAVVALEMANNFKKINFRLLVATAYSGFIFWHGGLSGSIPLLLNSDSSFSKEYLAEGLPLSQTLFSSFNISLIFTLIAVLALLNYWLVKVSDDSDSPREINIDHLEERHAEALSELGEKTPVEKLESSIWLNLIVFVLAAGFIFFEIKNGNFNVGLNQINFILLFLGLLLHKNIKSYLSSVNKGASKLGPILVQYPFYAGIMAVLTGTGLASLMSQFFVDVASPQSFPFLTFLSAGLVNIFVPSGGGQWAVQGPIVLPAVQELGANLTKSVMAVAWGDAWTNLLQPFWALPLLAIAGLKIRDIIGFCLINLLASGFVISAFLLFY